MSFVRGGSKHQTYKPVVIRNSPFDIGYLYHNFEIKKNHKFFIIVGSRKGRKNKLILPFVYFMINISCKSKIDGFVKIRQKYLKGKIHHRS